MSFQEFNDCPGRAMMKKAQYRYRPLGDDATIRIVTLEPGNHDEPLIGRLEVVSINSLGDYEALSYVWTDPEIPDNKQEILIQDAKGGEGLLGFDGGSVSAALRSLRCPKVPRRIWADQCCINQKDQQERSKQVKFMHRIYRDASQVLVWLGLDTQQVALPAFGLVHDLDGLLNNPSSDPGARLETYIADKRKPSQALTNRPWVNVSTHMWLFETLMNGIV